ncbi:hypothetical protein KFL_003710030 [Klebsormidium nitens]|uniref:Laminin EGF-like domain-containing protein n=1 Tax=Klebsormidium nitens TaxID=105231 RepID=A0A1Y1IG36_KLENI|nr:hypothetical protein KFL_003710030 [Klebsormidium nitens]|eukprot:GAQ87697.1 hypothetical protein KFL_003710030 [Klebsormidium nitens]
MASNTLNRSAFVLLVISAVLLGVGHASARLVQGDQLDASGAASLPDASGFFEADLDQELADHVSRTLLAVQAGCVCPPGTGGSNCDVCTANTFSPGGSPPLVRPASPAPPAS